jgi:hypothetical protein
MPSSSSPVARPSALRRTGAYALAACATLALAAPTARAQSPFTMTFNEISLSDPAGVGVVNVPNCYTGGGPLRITVVGESCGLPAMGGVPALVAFTPANGTGYTGSAALNNNLGFSVDFAAIAGGTFSLSSIDLAPIFLIGSPAMRVTFVGMRAGMADLTRTCDIAAGASALTRCAFADFTNLTSVRMTPPAPDFSVQFDNVSGTLNTAVIPEPATVALVGAGLLGAGAFARRRRSAA